MVLTRDNLSNPKTNLDGKSKMVNRYEKKESLQGRSSVHCLGIYFAFQFEGKIALWADIWNLSYSIQIQFYEHWHLVTMNRKEKKSILPILVISEKEIAFLTFLTLFGTHKLRHEVKKWFKFEKYSSIVLCTSRDQTESHANSNTFSTDSSRSMTNLFKTVRKKHSLTLWSVWTWKNQFLFDSFHSTSEQSLQGRKFKCYGLAGPWEAELCWFEHIEDERVNISY